MQANQGGTERSRVQLCGRMSVELDGVEVVTSLRGRQVRLLLAYLVIHRDRRIGREELIGAVWPGQPPRSQDAALRTLLSRLRAAAGPGLLVGREELTVVLPEPAWIDLEAAAAELENASQALANGDPRAAWARAQIPLNIAARGLLPGSGAPWLEPLRRDLAQVRLQALEIVGRAGLELGSSQLRSVERTGRTLIESEPYRESGYVLLMESLRRQGNVAEGLLVFERLRGLLREQLGTSPSPDAIAAHRRLLHPDAPPAPAPAPTPAPARRIGLQEEVVALSSQPLVGRDAELSELERWWTAAEGERALMLCGEPGIGKSRLLVEQARLVHEAGGISFGGRSPEETIVPYQPFVQAIAHYAREVEGQRLEAAMQGWGPELAAVVPEVGRKLPELAPAVATDPENGRYRLFEAVATLLGTIATAAPLLLILDDLQWADRPSLQLLRHLIRSPLSGRLRILGVYRLGEPLPPALQSAVTELQRDGLLRTLEVQGLPEPDATELVRLRTGSVLPKRLMHALHQETEGNPLFLQQMVQHLADSGIAPEQASVAELARIGLPEDVRGLISRRLARLSPDCIEVLRVASVIGRDFDATLLEAVLSFDEDRFAAALEEALDAGLIAEWTAHTIGYTHMGGYAFVHTVIRETLYEGMSAHRARRLHHRVGLELERREGPERVAALALHFSAAGEHADAARTVDYATRAGTQAAAMLANEEAAEHYERALEVLERSDPEALDRRMSLLLMLGEAHVRAGERQSAWDAFVRAAELAERLGDVESLTRAAVGASWRYTQPPGVVDEELIALLDRAVAATAEEVSVTRIRLLGRLAGALYYSPRREEMEALSREAAQLAAQLDDPEATALAAAARRRARWGPGDLAGRLADSTEVLQAADRAGNRELMLTGNAWLVVDLLERGDRVGVDAQIEAFDAGAELLRQPLFSWQAAIWRAMLALIEGRLPDAERLTHEALSIGMRQDATTAAQYFGAQLMALRREQLRFRELEPVARGFRESNPERLVWRVALTLLLCDDGRRDEAREMLAPLTEASLQALPRDLDWIPTLTLLAEAAVELEDEARARLLYELLEPHSGTVAVVGAGTVCRGAIDGYLGVLAQTFGDRDRAVAHLDAALDLNRALRAPLLLAYAQVELASALGAGAPARALLREARVAAAQLGVPRLERRVEAVVDALEV
ncbi:MAG TPA: AAA family ATPase [Solirubrobacteraceae bacterium]|nr:AAA family ATPase [Solirubrobacteraceae bacterium]